MGAIKNIVEQTISDDRIIRPTVITGLSLTKWKSKGLKPYYFNRKFEDYGLIGITEPTNTGLKIVYLLTNEEKNKVDQICKNVKEIIDLKYKSIQLLIDHGEAAMIELISK